MNGTMNCYSCEYKQYKEGNQTPGSKCPPDCTIINLLRGFRVVYQTLPLDVQQQIVQRFPSFIQMLQISE